jgi:hypothetical protein
MKPGFHRAGVERFGGGNNRGRSNAVPLRVAERPEDAVSYPHTRHAPSV